MYPRLYTGPKKKKKANQEHLVFCRGVDFSLYFSTSSSSSISFRIAVNKGLGNSLVEHLPLTADVVDMSKARISCCNQRQPLLLCFL